MRNKRKTPLIANFIYSFSMGGAQLSTLKLNHELVKRGYKVLIIPVKDSGELSEKFNEFEISRLDVPKHIRGLFFLLIYIKRYYPSILLSNQVRCNIISVLSRILSLSKVKLILIERTVVSQDISSGKIIFYNLIWNLAMKLLYRLADCVIAVSKNVAKDLSKSTLLPLEKIKIIYDPVIPTNFNILLNQMCIHPWLVHKRDGEIVIISAGRFSPEKGFDTLIKAFSLARKFKNLKLIILGDGKERKKLGDLIQNLGLSNFIDIPGSYENILPSLKKADLFVLSSNSEALGHVLIESLACGTPVVSTDCGGPREILEDGKYGILVPPGDPQALADGILKALSMEHDREALRQRGLYFSVDRAVDQYIEIFKELGVA